MSLQPLQQTPLIALLIIRIRPDRIRNLHQTAIIPFGILAFKKPGNVPLDFVAGEFLQTFLHVAIEHDGVAGQLLGHGVPVRFDPAPECVARGRVGTQGDGPRVRVLDGDLVGELEGHEVVDEICCLHAAEGVETDFFAVDGSGFRVLLLYCFIC